MATAQRLGSTTEKLYGQKGLTAMLVNPMITQQTRYIRSYKATHYLRQEIQMNEKAETYLITFEMTSMTDPNKWDWNSLLDPTEDESYKVHSVGQITRNNKETAQ
jgi:hypothetical protein